MKAIARLMMFACVPVFLLALAACSGKKDQGDKEDDKKDSSQKEREDRIKNLTILALALNAYEASHGKTPSKIEDLKQDLEGMYDVIAPKVKSGDIVVAWDVSYAKLMRDHIVAYEKDAPTKGGVV